jgi:hypothetical protein
MSASLQHLTCGPRLELHPVHVRQKDGTIVTYPGHPVIASEWVSSREAAQVLGLSVRTVERQCEQGLFKTAHKPGGTGKSRWRIERHEVESRKVPSAD